MLLLLEVEKNLRSQGIKKTSTEHLLKQISVEYRTSS